MYIIRLTICSFFSTDPNVDVIYVSPVALNDDMSQYYTKLFSLKSAIDSGDVENQRDMSERFKILTPEAIKSFPVCFLIYVFF